MLQQIKYLVNWLQAANNKAYYLAFLRVAISCMLLKEVANNWSSMELLYSETIFKELAGSKIDALTNGGFSFLKRNYSWLIAIYIVTILFYALGIGRWITALVLLLIFYLLQKMNTTFGNGGDVITRLVLIYLLFADTYQYFVLKKSPSPVSIEKKKLLNLLSNLAVLSIMLQLCLTYFALAVNKLNSPIWVDGEAAYYVLLAERYRGTSLNTTIAQYKWLTGLLTYFTILFELAFPLLIWVKRYRKPLLITGVIFHFSIYMLLMIYSFQWIFVLLYGFFLPNDTLVKFACKVKLAITRFQK